MGKYCQPGCPWPCISSEELSPGAHISLLKSSQQWAAFSDTLILCLALIIVTGAQPGRLSLARLGYQMRGSKDCLGPLIPQHGSAQPRQSHDSGCGSTTFPPPSTPAGTQARTTTCLWGCGESCLHLGVIQTHQLWNLEQSISSAGAPFPHLCSGSHSWVPTILVRIPGGEGINTCWSRASAQPTSASSPYTRACFWLTWISWSLILLSQLSLSLSLPPRSKYLAYTRLDTILSLFRVCWELTEGPCPTPWGAALLTQLRVVLRPGANTTGCSGETLEGPFKPQSKIWLSCTLASD